ncbi:MAG: hypothetical protein JWN11_2196 [Hyphomicrobiales bacterium]|nr:hypothetical protein [Hyphomicrobiales bacterium]
MKLFLRVLGTWLLALAVILLIIDGTKSLAASALMTTSMGDTWVAVNAQSLEITRQFLSTRFFWPLLDPVFTALLKLPGFAATGVPGLLLAFLFRSRHERRFISTDTI